MLVGGGRVAAAKLVQLRAAGAEVHVVAPEVVDEIARAGATVSRRPFVPSDLDGVWLAVAAATPAANAEVAAAAEARRVFVNAVDDPAHASAFLGGVVRRGGVTIAISTSGDAPALSGLIREALDAVLPEDVATWLEQARRERSAWRRDSVPMDRRRPLLLDALNRIYEPETPSRPSVQDTTATARSRETSSNAAGAPPPAAKTFALERRLSRSAAAEGGRRKRDGASSLEPRRREWGPGPTKKAVGPHEQ